MTRIDWSRLPDFDQAEIQLFSAKVGNKPPPAAPGRIETTGKG